MLIISDLHLRDESAEVVLGQVLPDIRRIAQERGETDIAILGDVFHFRYHVPVRLLNGLRDELRASAHVYYHILPGNHDQIDVQGRNALEHLDDLPHVSVYTEPTWNEHGLWFPYRKQELVPQLLQAEMNYLKPTDSGGKMNTLFIHHGIRGSWMNDNIQNTDGLDPHLFARFQMVICGHYHKHHFVLPRLAYVGSPYQTKADESGQAKGYCTWDGKTLEHVPMHWGKQYHRFGVVVDGKVDLTGVREGDEVRLSVPNKAAAECLGKVLGGMNITHIITVEPEKLQARLAVEDGASLVTFARAFVEVSETALDKALLLGVLEEIIR